MTSLSIMWISVAIAGLLAAIAYCTSLLLQTRQSCRAAEMKASQLLKQVGELEIRLADRDQQGREKDEFISTVSHELRTPLTSIRGALGLLTALLSSQADAKSINLLRIASSNTDRLVRLINDILDLERMDSGKAPLQLHPCSVNDLMEHAAETMGAMAEDAGIRLEQVVQADASAVEVDPDRIQQVLCNLLSNAIKFSPRGSAIKVFSGVDGPWLLLCVEDAGRGIPSDRLESVFDRFQQLEFGDSRHKGGSGLGLAICRSILQQHGGTIHAVRNDTHSPLRMGTTFVVRLPRLHSIEDLVSISAVHRRTRVPLSTMQSQPL